MRGPTLLLGNVVDVLAEDRPIEGQHPMQTHGHHFVDLPAIGRSERSDRLPAFRNSGQELRQVAPGETFATQAGRKVYRGFGVFGVFEVGTCIALSGQLVPVIIGLESVFLDEQEVVQNCEERVDHARVLLDF